MRQRILISSAGRRVGLLRCFRESARALEIGLDVHATDMDPGWSSACVEADKAHAAPAAGDDSFIASMIEICTREQIGLIVPTIDTELLAFAQARAQFEEIGTHVAVSDLSIVEIARDKLATAHFLEEAGVPTPRTMSAQDALDTSDPERWPVLAKPRHGSSSRGIAQIEDRAALAGFAMREPYVLQELLRGQEYTVSIYFDDHGALQCAIPHKRLKVRAGEVEKGVTERHDPLCRIAHQIAEAFAGKARGALCFQAIVDDAGRPSVFEINARYGGGYPLAHHAGAHFARWMLEERFGKARTASDDWAPGVTMLRYDDAVFI